MFNAIGTWFLGLPLFLKMLFWIFILMHILRRALKNIIEHKEYTLSSILIIGFIIIMVLLVKSLGIMVNDVVIV